MSASEPSREELLRLVAELNAETEALRRRLDESDWLGGALKQRTRTLDERVKELRCAYGLVRLIRDQRPLESRLRDAIALLPAAWQHAEHAGARIRLGAFDLRTDGFRESAWRQAEPIPGGGTVEVSYPRKFADADEGPFLKEERALLKVVAEALAAMR